MLNTNHIPIKRVTISGEQRYCFVPELNKEYIFKGKHISIHSIDSDLTNLRWYGKKYPKIYIKLTIADAQGQIKRIRILGNSCRLWKCCPTKVEENCPTVEEDKFDKAIRTIIMARSHYLNQMALPYCTNNFLLSQIPDSLVNDLKFNLLGFGISHIYYLVTRSFDYCPKSSIIDGTPIKRYIIELVERAFPNGCVEINIEGFKKVYCFSSFVLEEIDTDSVKYKISEDGIKAFFDRYFSIDDILGCPPPETHLKYDPLYYFSEINREFYFNNLCGEQL